MSKQLVLKLMLNSEPGLSIFFSYKLIVSPTQIFHLLIVSDGSSSVEWARRTGEINDHGFTFDATLTTVLVLSRKTASTGNFIKNM